MENSNLRMKLSSCRDTWKLKNLREKLSSCKHTWKFHRPKIEGDSKRKESWPRFWKKRRFKMREMNYHTHVLNLWTPMSFSCNGVKFLGEWLTLMSNSCGDTIRKTYRLWKRRIVKLKERRLIMKKNIHALSPQERECDRKGSDWTVGLWWSL